MTFFPRGAARPRTKASIINAAALVGCHPAMIAAFIEVEAAGSGYFPDGRLKVLPERHKVYELLPVESRAEAVRNNLAVKKWSKGTQYKDLKSAAQRYAFLDKVADAYGPELAADAASWGAGQVMGFNARAVGYSDAVEMVRAFSESEDEQIMAIARFLKANRLDDEARREDCYGLAAGYNGKGQVSIYGPRLQQALARHKKSKWDEKAPTFKAVPKVINAGSPAQQIKMLQQALADRNYPVGKVDGKWGRMTRDAVMSFKADNFLDVTEPSLALADVMLAGPKVIPTRVNATVADLREEGSETVATGDKLKIAGAGGTVLAAGSSFLGQFEEVSSYWSRIRWAWEPFSDTFGWIFTNPFIFVLPIGIIAFYYGGKMQKKRLEEYKAGKIQ